MTSIVAGNNKAPTFDKSGSDEARAWPRAPQRMFEINDWKAIFASAAVSCNETYCTT